MKKSTKIIIVAVVVLVAVLSAVAVILSRDSDSDGGNKDADTTVAAVVEVPSVPVHSMLVQPAPDLVAYTADKRQITLRSLVGQPVVICYWHESNELAVKEADIMQGLYEKYGDRVYFLMINVEDELKYTDAALAFAKAKGYTFPIYFDIDGLAGNPYGLYSVPKTVFVDKDGYFYDSYMDKPGEKSAEQIILEMLETKKETAE